VFSQHLPPPIFDHPGSFCVAKLASPPIQQTSNEWTSTKNPSRSPFQKLWKYAASGFQFHITYRYYIYIYIIICDPYIYNIIYNKIPKDPQKRSTKPPVHSSNIKIKTLKKPTPSGLIPEKSIPIFSQWVAALRTKVPWGLVGDCVSGADEAEGR